MLHLLTKEHQLDLSVEPKAAEKCLTQVEQVSVVWVEVEVEVVLALLAVVMVTVSHTYDFPCRGDAMTGLYIVDVS